MSTGRVMGQTASTSFFPSFSIFSSKKQEIEVEEKSALSELKDAREAFREIDPELVTDQKINAYIDQWLHLKLPPEHYDRTVPTGKQQSQHDFEHGIINRFLSARGNYDKAVQNWADGFIKDHKIDFSKAFIKVKERYDRLSKPIGLLKQGFHYLKFQCSISERKEKYQERYQTLERLNKPHSQSLGSNLRQTRTSLLEGSKYEHISSNYPKPEEFEKTQSFVLRSELMIDLQRLAPDLQLTAISHLEGLRYRHAQETFPDEVEDLTSAEAFLLQADPTVLSKFQDKMGCLIQENDNPLIGL